MSNDKIPQHAVLLYQCGLANVFLSHGDGRLVRAIQHAFGPCEDFARGLMAAGVPVKIMHANVAGDADIQRDKWQDGPGSMFEEAKNPPYGTVAAF